MSFGDAIATCLKKYATFSGRASRPEYWFFFLFCVLVEIGASILDNALGLTFADGYYGPFYAVAVLALLLPQLAAGARRLHDAGSSAWWLLIYLVPCVGWIIVIVMLCRPSQEGPNKYDAVAPGTPV